MADEFELSISMAARKGVAGTQVHTAPHGGKTYDRPARCRRLADIEAIICQSDLAEPVRRTLLTMFHRIARAVKFFHLNALSSSILIKVHLMSS